MPLLKISAKPEQTVTRAQMAKLIVAALGVADYATAKISKYTDMGAATWAIPYVEYASNLNIVNGVGNSKFNPNGLVTYEQAATMIVRALGYTDQCKEMNGTWPAIYIQKAMALNIFEDVVNGGANGANRGDVAIILYNAIELAEVYADADGTTHYKTGNNATYFNGIAVNGVTMFGTLNKNGSQQYDVISSSDADTALTDIRPYVGAAAKVTRDKNGDVIAVGDLKTTFLTGDVSSDAKKFSVGDKDYEISSAKFVDIDAGTGGATGSGITLKITNGKSSIADMSSLTADAKGVTIAAKVSGITIKEIYSVATWDAQRAEQVSDSDVSQITRNKKLLSKDFDKDDDGNIDTASFVLNGVSSLSDIKADNIVYVYTEGAETNGKIRRVDVGTKVVSGEITKTTTSKVTIDGTAYKFSSKEGHADIGDWAAGDSIKAYLDYDGKIYAVEFLESTAGNHAVVFDKTDNAPSGSAVASDQKIQLVTGDGSVKVFNVNGDKYTKNVRDNKSTEWTSLTKGAIVKYELDSDNKITKIYRADGNVYNTGKTEAANKVKTTDLFNSATATGRNITVTKAAITKSGYVNGIAIADNATIFTLKASNDAVFSFANSDDAGVTTLARIKDTTPNAMSAVINDKGKIVAMVVSNEVSSDDLYGIVTSTYKLKDDNGADFYIGTEKMTDKITDSDYDISVGDGVTTGALYKIKETTAGKYNMTTVGAIASTAAVTADGKTTSGAVKAENGYIVAADVPLNTTDGSVRLSLASNAVIYIYDKSDDDIQYTYFYKTDGPNDDNYGLVTYVVAYRK